MWSERSPASGSERGSAQAAVAQLSGRRAHTRTAGPSISTGADLLILDEPTNHLDVAAREWLERKLASLTRRSDSDFARPRVSACVRGSERLRSTGARHACSRSDTTNIARLAAID
jgi:hypothetical protein